jgi:DNA-binding response OmpR family regulator
VRVLMIEDEKRMALLLQKALQEKNHSAVTAFTGNDGLSTAQESNFDVIVLDLILPGRSRGCRALRCCRTESLLS